MILWIKNTLYRIDIILSDQFPSLAFKCRIIGKVDAWLDFKGVDLSIFFVSLASSELLQALA